MLAAEQADVLSRSQLHNHGRAWNWIERNRVAKRIQLVGDHAVVLHTGALTIAQTWWCALVNAGPHCVLDGPTGAEAAGLQGYGTELIHLSAPKGSRPRRCEGVVVRELRDFSLEDVHPVRKPPQMRAPVAIVRAALSAPNRPKACAILAAAVQQRIVSCDQLRAALERTKRHRYRRLLLTVLGDIEGGAHSLTEIDFARLCRWARLPEPTRQSVRHDGDGRRRYLDVEWEGFGIAVEIDGALHLLAASWWADMDRANEMMLAGVTLLRFSTVIVRLRPERVCDQLRRALLSKGWDGNPNSTAPALCPNPNDVHGAGIRT